MKKLIAFVMYTGIIGQGLQREFQNGDEYETVLITDYKNAKLYLNNKDPLILFIEVPDHSSYHLSYCLEVCDRFKGAYPQCKCMLFLSCTYMDSLMQEVIEAKRNGRIDGFATTFTRVEEIIAGVKALA